MADSDNTPNERSLEPVVNAVLGIETVDARRLHTFLEVRKDFSTWLRDRVEQYGFAENVDFVLLPKSGENSGRGQPAKEYAVSVDMAKELSMVERNEKGKQARRYFIECERRTKVQPFSSSMRLPRIEKTREARLTFGFLEKALKRAGVLGNQAVLSANQATARLTGVDMLGLAGVTHLPAPQSEVLLTPTDLGRKSGLGSAQKVNQRLCELDLQTIYLDAKGHRQYEPTETGRRNGGTMLDTGKKHGTGAPVRQLRWPSSVARLLKPASGDDGLLV